MRAPISRVALAAAAVAALGAAACSETRPTLTEPLDTRAYGIAFGRDGRNFPGGTVTFSRPAPPATGDSVVTLTLSGLDSLASGVYQVWLADTSATGQDVNYTKAVGNLTIVRTDTTFNAEGDPIPNAVTTTVNGVSAFSNGGPRTILQLRISRPTLGGNPFPRHLVLVSVEPDANSTAPTTTRVLWARRPVFSATATALAAAVQFGNFHWHADSVYRFAVSGRGTATVFGDLFQVIDSALARPPHGYYYEVHLLKLHAETDSVLDTLNAGPLRAPLPDYTSLYRADSTEEHAVVQERPYAITAAWVRVNSDTIPALAAAALPFRDFANVWVTLEHKAGRPDVAAPTIIISANLPDIIRFGPPTP